MMDARGMIEQLRQIAETATGFWREDAAPVPAEAECRAALEKIAKLAADAFAPAKEANTLVGNITFATGMCCYANNGVINVFCRAQKQAETTWTIDGWSHDKLRVRATIFGGRVWAKPIMQYIRNAMVNRANRHHRHTVNKQARKAGAK